MLHIQSTRLIRYTQLAHKYSISSSTIHLRNCSAESISDSQQVNLPKETKVVICGGGISGLSAAYNLAKLGLNDVVLLEKGRWVTHTNNYSYISTKHFMNRNRQVDLRSVLNGLTTHYTCTFTIL